MGLDLCLRMGSIDQWRQGEDLQRSTSERMESLEQQQNKGSKVGNPFSPLRKWRSLTLVKTDADGWLWMPMDANG